MLCIIKIENQKNIKDVVVCVVFDIVTADETEDGLQFKKEEIIRKINMRTHPTYKKAVTTNKITKAEAALFFDDLYKVTDAHIRANYPWYVKNDMWPLKACIKGGADKDPKFIVNHHTGSKNRTHGGAMARFFQSKMASANFVITDTGDILYLVKLNDMSYHATKRAGVIPFSVQKALGITDGKWLNEPGIEMVGNGNVKLFTHEALEASIVLQRIICAYFDGSVKELKSHRFFSPIDRSGDPGPLYFLPLVEHAVLNDYHLHNESTWFRDYMSNPVLFANELAEGWMRKLGVSDRDEWKNKRKNLRVTWRMTE